MSIQYAALKAQRSLREKLTCNSPGTKKVLDAWPNVVDSTGAVIAGRPPLYPKWFSEIIQRNSAYGESSPEAFQDLPFSQDDWKVMNELNEDVQYGDIHGNTPWDYNVEARVMKAWDSEFTQGVIRDHIHMSNVGDVIPGSILQKMFDPDRRRVWLSRYHSMYEKLHLMQKQFERPHSEFTPVEKLYARVRTTGIVVSRFMIPRYVSGCDPMEMAIREGESVSCQLVDCGGPRNERKKWIHCFDDLTHVLFFVPLNTFTSNEGMCSAARCGAVCCDQLPVVFSSPVPVCVGGSVCCPLAYSDRG